MRKIGTIVTPAYGSRFVDYLLSCGIHAHVDNTDDAEAAIWVEDEDRVSEARALLDAFVAAPDTQMYLDAGAKAEEQRRAERSAAAKFTRKVYDRKRITRHAQWTAIPVTRVLVLLSVAVTILGGLGSDSALVQWLSMTRYTFSEGQFWFRSGLPEVLRGQVWRLFTPVFLHASLLDGGFGLLHILFNMLWLLDLGGMIETVQGGRALLIKVVAMGIVSNLLQYFVVGPAFGGMSGVVFGLLGYSWILGRQDLTSGVYVNPRIMLMMTLWFVLGFSGMMGPIANAAHGGGLAAGVCWGYFSARRANVRRG